MAKVGTFKITIMHYHRLIKIRTRMRWSKEDAKNIQVSVGVTTVVAATAVLWGPAGLGGPGRPGLIMSTVTQPQ